MASHTAFFFFFSGFSLNELKTKDVKKFHLAREEVLKMINYGKLSPCIDSVCHSDHIMEASKQLTDRRNISKVIVRP